MNQIQQCTGNLIEAILKSEDYEAFLDARKRLYADSKKVQRTDYLRKKNFDLQEKESMDVFSEEMEQFTYEVENSLQDEDIDNYLAAEHRMCRILQETFREIVDRVDLDLEFLD